MGRIAAILLFLFATANVCAAETITSRPWPGITLESTAWTNPPMRFFIVTVDLTNPHIHLKVSRGGSDANLTPPWQVTLMPVSKIAQRDGLVVAVNGNLFQAKAYQTIMGYKFFYFEGNWAKVSGWAMTDGIPYWTGAMMPGFPSLVITNSGKLRMGFFDQMPSDARQIVSGTWDVVRDGRSTVPRPDPTQPSDPGPHTVAGIDRSGKKLMLFVVDGRRAGYSAGMDYYEMANFLLAHGFWNAVALDGGGSTTLVMRDASGKVNLLNRPSDGHDFPVGVSIERSVANALGVIIDPLPASRPSQP